VRERLLDAITDRLGLDRVAVRRRNLITAREMPFARPLKRSAPKSSMTPATIRYCSTRR
jgi:CO/xanthine dehydrogenase Mo-binding subunit